MKKACITKLGTDESETITDKEEIAAEFANYYKILYRNKVKVDRNQIKTYLSNLKLPRVLQEKNTKLTSNNCRGN